MAYRIIYTSAPRLLQAGRSGFGVVARHKEVPQDVVEFSERISLFSRAAGFPVDRVVYAYRVFRAPSGSWHIMSRISDAGASFTGRTNHLAEHLVIDEVEVQKLVTACGTPAGVMLACAWPGFFGDSRWLSPLEAWQATALRANPYGDKWAELCPDGNPKRRRLLSCGSGVATPIFFEYPDRLRSPVGAKEVLRLFGESESDCAKRGWGCAFTTDLQPSDNQADFQWIGLPSSSPLAASLKASGRKLVDFRSPVPESSVTKRSAAPGKIVPAPSAGPRGTYLSRAPRKRAARSSWPMWLKVLLGCLGVAFFVAVVNLAAYFSFARHSLSTNGELDIALSSSEPPPAATKTTADVSSPVPKEAVSSGKQFEQTFLVPFAPGQRPGKGGSADEEAKSLFSDDSMRFEYVEWQLGEPKSGTEKNTNYKGYGLYCINDRSTNALDLRFGSTDEFRMRPLRIVELVRQSDSSDQKLPFSEVLFVVDSVEESETVVILEVKDEDQSQLHGMRPGSSGQIVLRADKTLRARLGKASSENMTGDLAELTAPEDNGSLPKFKIKSPQTIRDMRKDLKDKAESKLPPQKSSLENVVTSLEVWTPNDNNSKSLLNYLLKEFGEEPIPDEDKSSGTKPEQVTSTSASADENVQSAGIQPEGLTPIFRAAQKKLSGSTKPGAKETGKILEHIEKTPDASALKQSLLGELKERCEREKEEQTTENRKHQEQAQKTLDDLFGSGNSLLPAGDYILGLSQQGSFYPAMKVQIDVDRSVGEQKGRVKSQKNSTCPERAPQSR